MKRKPVFLFWGVFFISASSLLFEVALTKIFSVTLWYHFAYLVVSLALFGLGLGGLLAYFMQKVLQRHGRPILLAVCLLQAIFILLCMALIANFEFGIYFFNDANLLNWKLFLNFAVLYLICSLPFLSAGFAIAYLIRTYCDQISKLYFADLAGAAAGCLGFIFLITQVSGPEVVLMASFIALLAGLSLYFFFYRPISWEQAAVFLCLTLGSVAAALGLMIAQDKTQFFKIKYTKTYRERGDILFEKWSPLSRITVYPTIWFTGGADQPFGWGMSRTFKPQSQIRQLWIEQDGSAGTPITQFDGDLAKLDFLKYDITSLPFHFKPGGSVFIIGSGGGRDVLTALTFGCRPIVACDINRTITDLVKGKFSEFAGGVYALPQVRAVTGEGRNYLRNSPELFDVVQISFIDSWAATVSGAFALSENSLYTVEAFRDYFTHLTGAGVLSVSRYLFSPDTQTLRAAILARRALESLGIAEPAKNIAVIGADGEATLLAKKQPFTPEEISRLRQYAKDYAFSLSYLPGAPESDPEFRQAMLAQPLEAYTRKYYYDVRPPTDDRPFFFQMLYFSKAIDLLLGKPITGQTFNYYAPLVLQALLVISVLLVCLFFIIPLWISRQAKALLPLWGLYFVLLGFGFMLIEISLIQKGSLYLGHPVYGISIVLFSILLFSGLGSFGSGRYNLGQLARQLPRFLIWITGSILVMTAGLEWLIPHTIQLALAAKIACFLIPVAAMTLMMGTAFPSGIRLVSRHHPDSLPWVWALNCGASVVGSILAMTIAMSVGYRAAMLLGAGVYGLAAVIMHRIQTKD